MLGHNHNFVAIYSTIFRQNSLKYAISLVFFLTVFSLYGQVGINTTNPQQALHIAGSTGTLRVESLNHPNNSYNGGGSEIFPLYVDDKGDFTLELKAIHNSEEFDDINNSELPGSSVSLLVLDTDGFVQTEIVSYTIDITREALLELKYNLSFEVYYASSLAKITDNLARRVQNFITVEGDLNDDGVFEYVDPRAYGPSSKCYSSGSINSVVGTLYNSSTAYISIPAAGTYTVTFMGIVSSNYRGSNGGNKSEPTYVKFATGSDMVFFRLH